MEEKDSKTMISVKHLSKKFGDVTVLKDINLDIKEKEVVVIIGPSGSGKSTILRCLNPCKPRAAAKSLSTASSSKKGQI